MLHGFTYLCIFVGNFSKVHDMAVMAVIRATLAGFGFGDRHASGITPFRFTIISCDGLDFKHPVLDFSSIDKVNWVLGKSRQGVEIYKEMMEKPTQ